MIITRTPFRISFVGGGSDLPDFYRAHGGAVLSTTIDKYMYISSHRFFESDRIRVKYSRTETVSSVEDIEHPIVRTVFRDMGVEGGLEVSSIADVPSGTGMGSSSSFTVGLVHNMHARAGHAADRELLARAACAVEIEKLGEPIGKQDQYAAAYGGLNVIRFNRDDSVSIEPVSMDIDVRDALERRLMLFYTGDQRSASAILDTQRRAISQADKQAALRTMVSLVDDLKRDLEAGDLDAMGRLLHENWMLKKELAAGITNPVIDAAYDAARSAGALGGKLLGAGGGGFLLFDVPSGAREPVRRALSDLYEFPFRFETGGSSVIFHDNTAP